MNPQERDLIQSVFDRLARAGVGAKDAEAEAMINERLCHQPDAAYGLVQAVIMQEMGLNQATQTINALQRQLEEARNAAGPQPTGSFLGGNGPWAAGSVPRVGQPMPPPPQAAPSPWSQQAAPSAPWSQPAAAPAPAANWGQPSAAGGFLRNAATMAAGVAGGALIAEGISSLFGGHHGYGGGFGGGFGGGMAGG
ncbi:MAG TPA: DUF2076 domain-containing protein, partial [Rhodospirillaceae bacterium]|nr:DUF2076 domain-containing protein [Rhodospirillaceae bacterium]